MKIFQTGPDRYSARTTARYSSINQRELARIVGLVALCLPGVLLAASLISYVIPDSLPDLRTCFRDSLSHYYYAPFWGGLFIGCLVFIATYLFVYQGEDRHGAERRLSTFAGFAALGVAIFPTSGHGCDLPRFTSRAFADFGPPAGADTGLTQISHQIFGDYFQMIPGAAWIHYASALTLFCFLAWFAFVVFTAADDDQKNPDGSLTDAKIMRNRLYRACGTVMVLCILALIAHAVFGGDGQRWNAGNWTFWCEAFALWAFGISWMVKGRFFETLKDASDRVDPEKPVA